MHEFALTQEIIRIAEGRAREHGARRVTRIEVIVGALSGAVPDSIEFYFDHLATDTIVQGATLAFVRVAAQATCRSCGQEFEPQEYDWSCPGCQGLGADIIAGKELSVAAVELEES